MKLHVSSTEGKVLTHQQVKSVEGAVELVLFDSTDFEGSPTIETQHDGSIILTITNAGDITKRRVMDVTKIDCWSDLRFEELETRTMQ